MSRLGRAIRTDTKISRIRAWAILAVFTAFGIGFLLAWSISYHFPAGTVCFPPR